VVKFDRGSRSSTEPNSSEDVEIQQVSGQPTKKGSEEESLKDEALDPMNEPSWDWFLNNGGAVGMEGPAKAAWLRLNAADRRAIRAYHHDHGGLNMRDMWACTWLKAREWESPCPKLAERLRVVEADRRHIVVLSPGSLEFAAEYERRLAAGEDVSMMDGARRRGGVCTVYVP